MTEPSPGNGSAVPPFLVNRHPSQRNGTPPVGLRPLSTFDPAYLPSGMKSLSGISIRAFSLGIALGITIIATVQLAYYSCPLWRAPFFIAVLALFHYLEFDSTARFNPPDAKIDSFLLSANGSAYNVAHTAALTELFVRQWLSSDFKPAWLSLPFTIPPLFPTIPTSTITVAVGMALIVIGQYVRTAAMAQAGKSFNHVVQSTKKDDHVLVTSGVYSFSRHPSYFGFFWWGLGTQLVLGNLICFPAYAVVLWKFFANRIYKEEQFLVEFFGQDYVAYRQRTAVLIPFIS